MNTHELANMRGKKMSPQEMRAILITQPARFEQGQGSDRGRAVPDFMTSTITPGQGMSYSLPHSHGPP